MVQQAPDCDSCLWVGPPSGGTWRGRETHWPRLSRCAVGLQGPHTLGSAADAPAQHDPTLRPSLTSTRLPAQAALEALRAQGDREERLPQYAMVINPAPTA
jgi:hypothetical protein